MYHYGTVLIVHADHIWHLKVDRSSRRVARYPLIQREKGAKEHPARFDVNGEPHTGSCNDTLTDHCKLSDYENQINPDERVRGFRIEANLNRRSRQKIYERNDFAEGSKILVGYRSENNFVWTVKK